MHELPLLIFTLFLQGSVGVTLWLAFGSTQRSALLPAAGAFVLASLGLLASALHMPRNRHTDLLPRPLGNLGAQLVSDRRINRSIFLLFF